MRHLEWTAPTCSCTRCDAADVLHMHRPISDGRGAAICDYCSVRATSGRIEYPCPDVLKAWVA